LDHLHDPGPFTYLPEIAESRAVADEGRAPRLLDKPYGGTEDLGVRCYGTGRLTGLQEIRLDQDPVPGVDERGDAAEQIDSPSHGLIYPLLVVICTADDGNIG
jgi:hypothetical protein